MTTQMPGIDELAYAILNRIAEALAVEIPEEELVLDQPIFVPGGFSLGPFDFDSVELAEIIVVLEEELAVDLLDVDDLTLVESTRKLASFVHATGRAEPANAFCAKYGQRGKA